MYFVRQTPPRIVKPLTVAMLLISTSTFSRSNANELSDRGDRILHITSYSSRTGNIQLTVDPSHMFGCYEANYSLAREGVKLWSKTLPFTLWDAKVTDAGGVVGFAYTQGIDGHNERNGDPPPGHLVVAIIDRDGNVVLEEKTQRTDSRFLHGSPTPLISGIELSGNQKSFLLRVDDEDLNSREEHWKFYDIDEARVTSELRTKFCQSADENSRSIIHVKSIPSTDLWIVQLWTNERRKSGTAFVVCDAVGAKYWELSVPNDYELADEELEDKLRDKIVDAGAILECDFPRQFSIQLFREAQKVTFRVESSSDRKWRVSEIDRSPSGYPIDQFSKPDPTSFPNVSLPFIGKVELQSPKTDKVSHPVRDMACEFDMDEHGNFGFIRKKADVYEFASVDSTGKLLTEFDLPWSVPADFELDGITYVGAGRFVVAASNLGVGSEARAWRIDSKKKSVVQLTSFRSPGVDDLVGMPDGRFVVLATERHKYTMSSQLQLCDSDGRSVKIIPEGYEGFPHKLFSPKAITVNLAGEICVLDVIKRVVVVYGGDGEYRRTLKLAQLWNREPNYPSDMTATQDGGLLVHDFHGAFPLVQMSSDGKVIAQFDPRPAVGRETLNINKNLRAAPDGHFWLTEGPEIVRLDAKGLVDRRLGVPADTQTLDGIDGLHVDRQGTIYAQSSRTGAIHAFDLEGKLQRIVHHDRLLDHDFDRRPINLTDDDELVVSDGKLGSATLLFFDRTGNLIETFRPPAYCAYYQPVQDRFLCDDLRQLRAVTRDGVVHQIIERHADRTWLEPIKSVAVADDGSFAVLTSHSKSGVQSKVTIYERDYTPRSTINSDVYADSLDYDGTLLSLDSELGSLVFRSSGEIVGLIRRTGSQTSNNSIRTYLVSDRAELISVEQSIEPAILRYDMTKLQITGNQNK